MDGSSGGDRRVRAVFFDIGETLIDESTEYGTWADWLGVPRHTFSAMFGAVVARGEDYRTVFGHFRPGFDLEKERQTRLQAGMGEHFDARDLYLDVRPCVAEVKARGYMVGLAGNQTARAGRLLRELNLPVDVIATSEEWGAEKPTQAFFQKMIEMAGFPAGQIAYVGDRVDNDLLPAAEAGLVTVFIRRGPWGYVLADRPEVDRADIRLTSLADLPAALDT